MEPLPFYRVFAPVAFVVGLAILCAIRDLPRFRAMLLGIFALTGYGMLQDQVSARLCPEYFTVLHPPIPGLTDPTWLGVAWGFLGAWWGGAIFGYAAGIAATVGSRPPLPLRELVRPLCVLLATVASVTALTGVSVARHAEMFGVALDSEMARAIPPERHRAAFVVACYHFVAYGISIVGGIVLCVWVARRRETLQPSAAMTLAGRDYRAPSPSASPGSR